MSVLFAVFALGERVIVTSAAWQRERAKQEAGQPMGETVQPGEAEAGVIWFERSQVLHFSSIREIDIHQVQCLTLLSAFQASVNAMPMSWLLASQALRIAQDIGLHVSWFILLHKLTTARCSPLQGQLQGQAARRAMLVGNLWS